MEDVHFRLLGPMEMTVAGKPAALPGPAERALLVQLLLAPRRTVPATALVDRLWSDSTLPADPMNALQIRVSKLRRSLKAAGVPELVTREGVGYRSHVAGHAVDAVEFVDRVRRARSDAAAAAPHYDEEHLDAFDAALELWRGDPLSDFATEQWAAAEAVRLRELRISALTERAQLALALGHHSDVIADLEPILADDPTLEMLAGSLMLALYRGGRQADALEVYARTRRVLDDQLGLEPSVSLRALHEQILRQDPSLRQAQFTPPATSTTDHRRPKATVTGPTNLPAVTRPLIGRDELLESIGALLDQTRLLSLVGPGGAGKTSLALATAVRAVPSYADGVFAVRLASVNDPGQVPVAVADAVGMPMDGAATERDIRERLATFLARRRLLLVLDNCEHVIDAAAGIADQILSRCPDVALLTTSREALAVPDEIQVNVDPLEVPPEGTPPTDVLTFPAAQLYVERARAVRPGTVFSEADLDAVGRIARALDGIPLALELAAARSATMSATEISSRLENRFDLLTSGSRTAEERQRTLRATVEWSYALLTDEEQRVFSRLSVFQGGCTLQAAEAVVGDDDGPAGAVLDVVARLVQRSMLLAETGTRTRYRMLETLRQYAMDQLDDAREASTIAARHANYFHDMVLTLGTTLRGHGQREALSVLRQEQPNIRAAFTWLSGPDGDIDTALEMAGALGLFWHLGRHLEGRDLLAGLLRMGDGSAAARAHALQAVSLVERPRACLVHPSPLCAETAQASLDIFEAEGDTASAALSKVLLAVEGVTGQHRERQEALLRDAEHEFGRRGDEWGLGVIGFVRMETALKTGELDAAIAVGHAAAARFRQLDDPWGLSAVLYHLGWGLRQFGHFEAGARTLAQAIDVAQQAGLYNTVQWAYADLALVELNLGNVTSARELFDRASAASVHVGDGAGEVLADYGHGLLALLAGDVEEADRRFQCASDGFVVLKTPVWEGWALLGSARCAEIRGEHPTADALYARARELGATAGEPGLVASSLEGLSRTAAARGTGLSDALAAEAVDVRRRLGRPRPPYQDAWLDSAVAHK